MNQDLLRQHQRISLEAETAGLMRLTGDVTKMLQSYVVNIKSFMNDTVTSIKDLPTFDFAKDSRLDRLISKTNYVSLSTISVYVPAGVNTTWLQYLEALETSQSVVDRLLVDTIKPATAYFSMLLASPENLSSVTHRLEVDKIVFHDAQIEKAKKATAACYAKHGVNTKRAYGDVFKRNGDWPEAQKELEELVARQSKVSLGEVSKQVNDLTEIMDRLVIRMRQNPEVYAVSGVTADALSTISLKLGLEVEFYAAHTFMLQSASAAMQDTIKHLTEVLKD